MPYDNTKPFYDMLTPNVKHYLIENANTFNKGELVGMLWHGFQTTTERLDEIITNAGNDPASVMLDELLESVRGEIYHLQQLVYTLDMATPSLSDESPINIQKENG